MYLGKPKGPYDRVARCAVCGVCVCPWATQAQAWTHPGIVVSQDQLNASRAAYQAGNSVIVDQINKAKNSNNGSLSYSVKGPWPGGINQCGFQFQPQSRLSETRMTIPMPRMSRHCCGT